MKEKKCPKCEITLKDQDPNILAINYLFSESSDICIGSGEDCNLCGSTYKEQFIDKI